MLQVSFQVGIFDGFKLYTPLVQHVPQEVNVNPVKKIKTVRKDFTLLFG